MFWKDRTVAITGASGYLGGMLTRRLRAAGARVIGLDARAGRAEADDQVTVDLCERGAVERALRQFAPQTLFHLAGQSGVAQSQKHPAAAFVSNAQATWTLLDACRELDAQPEIVVASSNHVYGHQASRPTGEDAALNGNNAYAASKVCTDVIARCFATYGMPIVIARITNSFGGTDPHLEHLIAGTIMSALRGERPVIRGNGSATKAYLYVEDTVDGLVCLAEHLSSKRLSGEAFNIVGEQPLSVLQTVRAVLDAIDRRDLEPQVLSTDTEEEEVEHLSGEKMLRRLGWRPQHSFEAGLHKAISDYRAILNADRTAAHGH